MPKRSILVIFLFLSLLGSSLHAEDLGTIGPTYEIAERDLIEVIQDKFRHMEKTGELAGMWEDYKHKVIAGIERPRPVPGIRATETARTFFVDPTWTLDRNVVNEQGAVLYPAGTRINPLDYEHLSQALLFFDGRDRKQIAFAKRFMAESRQRVKPILVGGEPMKLMREWKREVFYDQGGALSRRFSITQTPAIVSQEGRTLRVDEVRL